MLAESSPLLAASLLWLCCRCSCGGCWWWLPNGRIGLLEEPRPTLLLLLWLPQPRCGDGGGLGIDEEAEASKDWLLVGRESDAKDDNDEVRVHRMRVRAAAPGDSGPSSAPPPPAPPATPVAAESVNTGGGGTNEGGEVCRWCAARSSSLSKSKKFS